MERRHNIIFLLLASIVLGACNKECKVDNEDVVESPVIANDLSNQKVTAFAEDGQGHVWIGTINGLCLYTDQDKFKNIPQDYSPLVSSISLE